MTLYKELLSCWHKLEHYNPASLPKSKLIQVLSDKEPWKVPIRPSKPDMTFEYIIYLGVFKASYVNEFVKEFFKDKKKEENRSNNQICFATLRLDINGNYIDKSICISTLPWALSQLEKGNIKNDSWLEKFSKLEEDLSTDLETFFNETLTNEKDEVIEDTSIVSADKLKELETKIENLCGWSVKPEKTIYVNRVEKYQTQKKSNNDQNDILNSFYIKDLEKVISKLDEDKKCSKAFYEYLDGCLNKKSERTDLSKNINSLKKSLTPRNYPDGCWPSTYNLSLMQQYAVNNIFNELSGSKQTGLFSVNGPPGTGKTTLLRDIIAPIIVKRAKKLSKIKSPPDAFSYIGKIEIKEGYSPFIYTPNKEICDYGIVVASSNNGAVENISKELPLKSEVSIYSDQIEYFRTDAEECINIDNWGLISAVLGNKKNRNSFINSLWYDFKGEKIIGLQKSLKENRPADNSEWEEIVKIFDAKYREVKEEKERLELIKEEYNEVGKVLSKQKKIQKEFEDLQVRYSECKSELKSVKVYIKDLEVRKKEALNELTIINQNKPGFLAFIFSRKLYKEFKKSKQSILKEFNAISEEFNRKRKKLDELEKLFTKSERDLKNQSDILDEVIKKVDLLNAKTEKDREELRSNYADYEYWENIESKESQESCPWYSEKLKKLQSELFIISLKLNEKFILSANSKSSRISTTLSGFFEYLKGSKTPTKEEVKAMWDTFFLVIPVISTTFASVQSMFKDLEEEDIPWLFIDEAGQAVPQAAAGSIWRSKRVVVVGDPFQIEPVVTIPAPVTDNISEYFQLDNNQINSELSVQSMADRINPLGAYLNINDKDIWIGIPLRVHRRCINPMFEISNRIAYDNTMFLSTADPKRVSVNFESSFIHCNGSVEGRHFVENQAEIIRDILIKEISTIRDLPDIFVITPFSEVSFKLNSYLFKPLIKEIKNYKDIDKNDMGIWLKTHIGTVHTFQGKQAEGVILCLGLDEKTQGAANWASQKPNLLNVAITRAKYRFIAVGDGEIWLRQPYFKELKRLLNDY